LAIAAGYSDSAHFSHTIRSYFGGQASKLYPQWRALSAFTSLASAEAKPEWLPLN
jgi:hypothetical protein